MELIGFKELLTAALIFTIGAFFKPLFLVLRDWAAWWLVERYVITDKLVRAVRKRESVRKSLQSQYSFDTSEKAVDGKPVFEIDGKEVSKKEYQTYRDDKQRLEESFDLRDSFIRGRIIFADKVTRHFSQHPENPVLALCRAIEQRSNDDVPPKHFVQLSEADIKGTAESKASGNALRRSSKPSHTRDC